MAQKRKSIGDLEVEKSVPDPKRRKTITGAQELNNGLLAFAQKADKRNDIPFSVEMLGRDKKAKRNKFTRTGVEVLVEKNKTFTWKCAYTIKPGRQWEAMQKYRTCLCTRRCIVVSEPTS